MVELAKNQLDSNEDIKYILGDCSAPLNLPIKFDIVASTFLLIYAELEEMLEKFVRCAFDSLKSGGRFIGLNLNMKLKPDQYKHLHKYGHE